jgi:hypothetical protein
MPGISFVKPKMLPSTSFPNKMSSYQFYDTENAVKHTKNEKRESQIFHTFRQKNISIPYFSMAEELVFSHVCLSTSSSESK